MPDLRYHVVSLIGVFIALSLGLLLGIALAEGDSFEAQLRAQVDDIRGDLERQRDLIADRDEEISELEEENASAEEVLEGMSDVVIGDQLAALEVAVVTGPWASADARSALQRDLTDAGATIVANETLEAPGDDTTTAQLETAYVEQAREVLGAEEAASTTATTTADDLPEAPDVVVFLGGGDPPTGTEDETLQSVAEAEEAMFVEWEEAAGEEGDELRVVAAETSEAERSEVGLFQDVGVPSVDNVDTPAGRAAVVLLAAGDTGGAYGEKETASDPFPPPPAE